jgi:hypothetical protein
MWYPPYPCVALSSVRPQVGFSVVDKLSFIMGMVVFTTSSSSFVKSITSVGLGVVRAISCSNFLFSSFFFLFFQVLPSMFAQYEISFVVMSSSATLLYSSRSHLTLSFFSFFHFSNKSLFLCSTSFFFPFFGEQFLASIFLLLLLQLFFNLPLEFLFLKNPIMFILNGFTLNFFL